MTSRRGLTAKFGAGVAAGMFVLISAVPLAGASATHRSNPAVDADPVLCAAAKATMAQVAILEADLTKAKANPPKSLFGLLSNVQIVKMQIQLVNLQKVVDPDLKKACGI